jgi:hypothetical protein
MKRLNTPVSSASLTELRKKRNQPASGKDSRKEECAGRPIGRASIELGKQAMAGKTADPILQILKQTVTFCSVIAIDKTLRNDK